MTNPLPRESACDDARASLRYMWAALWLGWPLPWEHLAEESKDLWRALAFDWGPR